MLGCRPAPRTAVPLTGASASSVRFEIIRPTLGLVVQPFAADIGPAATMASADFWQRIRGPSDPRSTAARHQISPGIAHSLSRLCASDLRHRVPYTYRALHLFACLPRSARLYPLPVRRASALPPASFRPPVARGALAVQLTLPRVGCVEDFHLQESAPCRAHRKPAHASLHGPATGDFSWVGLSRRSIARGRFSPC